MSFPGSIPSRNELDSVIIKSGLRSISTLCVCVMDPVVLCLILYIRLLNTIPQMMINVVSWRRTGNTLYTVLVRPLRHSSTYTHPIVGLVKDDAVCPQERGPD